MRRTLIALAVAAALTARAADAALLAPAPAEYTAVISLELRRLLDNRDFRQWSESPAIAATLSELGRGGVRISGIRALTVFYWDDNWYGVLKMDPAVRLREQLERKCADPSAKITAETLAGRRVYLLHRPPIPGNRHRKKELCFTFLGDDTVVVAKFLELEKFLKVRRLDPAAVARLAERDADAWFVCRMHEGPDARRKNGEFGAFGIKSGALELRLTGGKATAIALSGVMRFAKPSKAREMSMTLPAILAFFTGLVFSEDQEGGAQFVRALRSSVRGDTLRLSLDVSEDLFRRFLRGVESLTGRQNGVGAPARVPRPQRSAK